MYTDRALLLVRKFIARAVHVCFVGIERDGCLCRTFDPISKKVYIVRFGNFKSRLQKNILSYPRYPTECFVKPREITWLAQAITLRKVYTKHFLFWYPNLSYRYFQRPQVTTNTKTQLVIKNGVMSLTVNTKHCVKDNVKLRQRNPDTNVLPIKRVFRIKPLDCIGRLLLQKSSSCFVGNFNLQTLPTTHTAHVHQSLHTSLSAFYFRMQSLSPKLWKEVMCSTLIVRLYWFSGLYRTANGFFWTRASAWTCVYASEIFVRYSSTRPYLRLSLTRHTCPAGLQEVINWRQTAPFCRVIVRHFGNFRGRSRYFIKFL